MQRRHSHLEPADNHTFSSSPSIRLASLIARLLIEVKRPAALLLVSMQVAPLMCFAADTKGLKEERKITITDQLAGSPLPGSRPASIWAISFSPDETYIAVGVEFTKKKTKKQQRTA